MSKARGRAWAVVGVVAAVLVLGLARWPTPVETLRAIERDVVARLAA